MSFRITAGSRFGLEPLRALRVIGASMDSASPVTHENLLSLEATFGGA